MTVRQKRFALKSILPTTALLLFSYAIMLSDGVFVANHLGASSPNQQNVPAISTDIDSTWRYTSEGWQDASGWQIPETFAPIRTFELVHPFVWAMIVLLAVIVTLVWASNESEIAGLFRKRQSSGETDQPDSLS